MSQNMRLILGSASPRRRELLGQIGIVPDEVRVADIDESPLPGEIPRTYCHRIACAKSEAIPPASNEIVLTADTTVCLGRRVMGKPKDRAEAGDFLRALSGRRHRVITSVAVRTIDRMRTRDVATRLKMKHLSDTELSDYLDSDEWEGKAGAYGIQGLAGAFVPWISGSFTAVVGLPLAETAQLLRAAGYHGGQV